MSRPTRPVTDAETSRIIAADALLTLAESNLRAAISEIRTLRYDGVPVRQLMERLGLSRRAVHGIGPQTAGINENGPLVKALASLTTARWSGIDRRRVRTRDES